MSIPSNKQELIAAIKTDYERLHQELITISPDLAEIKDLEGHAKNTLMSVKDLVSYLIGWGQLVLKWNHKKDRGEEVNFPETGFKWNELGRLAQKFYADYKNESLDSLLDKLKNTVEEIISLVENKTNAQLYKVPWYDKYTLGRMIQLNTSSPYKNARNRIRGWKKTTTT